MIRRVGEVYVLTHADKLGRSPFHSWVRMPSRWTQVTDDGADPRLIAEFTARGANVVVVSPDPVGKSFSWQVEDPGRMTTPPWTTADMPDQTGRTVVVTGGNSGLGFETCKAFAERGAAVIMAARDEARGLAAASGLPGRVAVLRLDLADLGSVRTFAAEVAGRGSPIDVLVNNAGIGMPEHSVTALEVESQFAVNHLGHFALTGLLLPMLRDGARVVTVASNAYRHGKIDFENLSGERSYSASRFYEQSKFANVVHGIELDRRLRATGTPVTSVLAHPGFARTNLPSSSGRGVVASVLRLGNTLVAQSAERGARGQLLAATAPGVEGGQFYGPGGLTGMWGDPVLLRPVASVGDPSIGRRLWEVSTELTGVVYPL